MNIYVIIPALNEGGNIRRLVHEIPRSFTFPATLHVIVVNNGSTDNTAEEAHAAGVTVVHEPRRGYGYACAAGVSAAVNADVLVFMDGDGSFDPAEMPLLLEPIAANQADLVLGSRAQYTEPGSMPPHQLFGNRLVARLMWFFYGLKATDLAPYRAIRRDVLLRLNMCEMTFGWPQEMVVKAARQHRRIIEVSVHYRKRWSGVSKVSGTLRGTLLATYFILWITVRYALFPSQSGKDNPNR
jgi:glycosyltransferase involved in cell wall biosynthesis